MSAPTLRALSVFHGQRLVGTLLDTTPLSFIYAPQWLNSDETQALPNIPMRATPVDTPAVESTFENLLPEGILRDILKKKTQSSNTFGLLLAVAGDTAGGLTILPAGQHPKVSSYQSIDWADINNYLDKGVAVQGATAPLGGRISLAGAQTKVLIGLSEDGRPMLPLENSPSTWIVKPNIRGFEQVWCSATNEAIVMRAAAYCALDVAQVFFEPTTRSCVIKRFDRLAMPDGSLIRLRQYDFCQLSGLPSTKKYESEGGPSLAQCAELIRSYSSKPATDLVRFCDWIIFNLYTGNNDSHAKNLALCEIPGQGLCNGMRLSPFYDLMDTRLYSGLSERFAFTIGGESRPGHISREHLIALADEFNLKPTFLLSRANLMYSKLAPALMRSAGDFLPVLDPAGKTLAQRLCQHISKLAFKNASRLVNSSLKHFSEDFSSSSDLIQKTLEDDSSEDLDAPFFKPER